MGKFTDKLKAGWRSQLAPSASGKRKKKRGARNLTPRKKVYTRKTKRRSSGEKFEDLPAVS